MSTTSQQITEYRASRLRVAARDAGLTVGETSSPVDFSIEPASPSGSYLAVSVSYATDEITVARVMSGGRTAGRTTFDGLSIDLVVDAVLAIAKGL